jgi:hypothetical protein
MHNKAEICSSHTCASAALGEGWDKNVAVPALELFSRMGQPIQVRPPAALGSVDTVARGLDGRHGGNAVASCEQIDELELDLGNRKRRTERTQRQTHRR